MSQDPVLQYLQLFEQLRTRKRWSDDTTQLRFIALSLASMNLADPYTAVEAAAKTLREKSGWFGPLNSKLRYAVAAMIVKRGLSPARVHDRLVETRKRFRKRGLPWSEGRKTIAALLLVLHYKANRVPEGTLQRMADLYRLWKAEHRWLTGQDDYPMLALHSLRDEELPALARRMEDVYRGLRGEGFPAGNPLQLASHLICSLPGDASKAVRRFTAMRDAFQQSGEKIRSGRLDEVALLSLIPAQPRVLARQVLETRDRLRAEKPRPNMEMAFSLATGIQLGASTELAKTGSAAEIAAIQAAQQAIEAQQAAIVVCIAASSAAAASN